MKAVDVEIQAEKIHGCVVSDIGPVRRNNEDNYLLGHCVNERQCIKSDSQFYGKAGKWTCAGVFDGMGGVEGGEVASYCAATTFQEHTMEIEDCEQEELDNQIKKLFCEAHMSVVREQKIPGTCGTTAAVVLTDGRQMKACNLGDSRIYLYRKMQIKLLSKDHTLAQLKLDAGIYHSVDQVSESEYHKLTEYIGMDEFEKSGKPYVTPWTKLIKGDVIAMCSDGLYSICSETMLADILSGKGTLEQKAEMLLAHAIHHGGNDNITVLLMEVE